MDPQRAPRLLVETQHAFDLRGLVCRSITTTRPSATVGPQYPDPIGTDHFQVELGGRKPVDQPGFPPHAVALSGRATAASHRLPHRRPQRSTDPRRGEARDTDLPHEGGSLDRRTVRLSGSLGRRFYSNPRPMR